VAKLDYSNRVIVVVNLTSQRQQVTLDVGEFADHYTEVFKAEERALTAQEQSDLEPWAYRVYVNGSSQTTAKGKP